ncbi:hypothetical protein E2562_007387 [Oryza meyeriana var. granulata]|uniref:Uncharacterized protein n=1 Tax=Oryza meyeriana var. granulata TaxID=110450 RepID=A0A6G1CZP1_9ORYZ|nr:hypothetical protein E2562_007387 [Oryza meyeriana var. granulata]
MLPSHTALALADKNHVVNGRKSIPVPLVDVGNSGELREEVGHGVAGGGRAQVEAVHGVVLLTKMADGGEGVAVGAGEVDGIGAAGDEDVVVVTAGVLLLAVGEAIDCRGSPRRGGAA